LYYHQCLGTPTGQTPLVKLGTDKKIILKLSYGNRSFGLDSSDSEWEKVAGLSKWYWAFGFCKMSGISSLVE
jgi:hypothetical protein